MKTRETPPLRGRLLRSVVSSLGRIPIKVRASIGRACGTLVSLVPSRERSCAELQLVRYLGIRDRAVIRRVYATMAENLFESLNLEPYLRDPDLHVTCDDWPLIRELLDERRGIVCLTAHTGNWELLAAYMVRKGMALTVVGREARDPVFQEILSELRNRYGVRVLWRSDGAALRQILSELREGRVVAALIDQDTRVTSVHVPFFGEPAKTPSTLAVLGRKHGFIIVSTFMVRTAPGRFRVFVRRLDHTLSAEEIIAQYHDHLEEVIREYPDQWVWFHKRWRTLTDGTSLSSAQYLERLRSSTAPRAVSQ